MLPFDSTKTPITTAQPSTRTSSTTSTAHTTSAIIKTDTSTPSTYAATSTASATSTVSTAATPSNTTVQGRILTTVVGSTPAASTETSTVSTVTSSNAGTFGTGTIAMFPFQPTTGSGLVCPKCTKAHNVHVCGEDMEQCSDDQDICVVTLKRWQFTVGCGKSQKCHADISHNRGTCDGSKPFGPRDRCTVCCTGNDCVSKMRAIQHGLDTIPNVIHCPECKDEKDPQKCVDNFVPCNNHYHTCEVSVHNGLYTARCFQNATTCLQHHDNANKLQKPYCIGASTKCSACCNDHDCIDYTLGLERPPTSVPINVIQGTSPTLTFSPPGVCHDQTLFPCHLAVGDACTDLDIATEFCRETCGVCLAPSTTPLPTTTHHKSTTAHAKVTTSHHHHATPVTTSAAPSHGHHSVGTTQNVHSTADHHTTKSHHHIAAPTQGVHHTAAPTHGVHHTVYGCPDGWTQFEAHCFMLNSSRLTFTQAAEYCESKHGRLIELQTKRKNDFMKHFMKDKIVHNGIWLGGNDLMFEGSFVWDKSEAALTFKDWSPGEPNSKDGKEDCLTSWTRMDYQWADHYCGHADLAALCERSAVKCS